MGFSKIYVGNSVVSSGYVGNKEFYGGGYSITYNITHGVASGSTKIKEGQTVVATITPSTGYYLPAEDELTITGASFVYDKMAGTITLSNPTENVSVTFTCPEESYSMQVFVTNGTYTGDEYITYFGTAAITITPNTGYYLPENITISGVNNYTYNSTTGVISMSGGRDVVNITATCPAPPSYFTLTATSDGSSVCINDGTSRTTDIFEYSTDGENWNNYTFGTIIDLDNGQYVQFRGDNTYISETESQYIGVTIPSGSIAASGNMNTLFDKSGKATSLPISIVDGYTFINFFNGATRLVDISELTLPATYLCTSCYKGMFYGCTGLTSIPSGLLPATTYLATYCYYNMFQNCTGLTSIPSGLLPATALYDALHPTDYCYGSMFLGCTGLTSIPSNLLPATTLSVSCYRYMFQDCTGLTSLPANLLPATSLKNYCYSSMFRGCTGLTSIPSGFLPATTLNQYCYSLMFCDCTGLTSLPAGLLSVKSLYIGCYQNMFNGCTSLTSLPANLLPATTLKTYCYYRMFYGCIELITLPTLPATTLANYCYKEMFYACSAIKLSATQTEEYTNTFTFGATPKSTYASDMFTATGGTFTGTPTAQTYYTSNTIV